MVSRLPGPSARLLLRAALSPPAPARTAWEEWKAAGGNIDTLGPREHALLPLIAANFARNRIQMPEAGRLQGIHRRTWYRDQLLAAHVASAIAALEGAGIRTVLLKGGAILATFDRDFGARHMNDMDVLVPRRQARRAVVLLRQQGWAPVARADQPIARTIRYEHGVALHHPKGGDIDLHWYALAESQWRGADRELWRNAMPAALKESATRVPSPDIMLMHLLVNGVRWGRSANLRWPADAIAVLDAVEGDFPWDGFVAEVAGRRVGREVAVALRFLAQHLGVAIPPDILERIGRPRPSLVDRLGGRAAAATTFRHRRWNLLAAHYLRVSAGWPLHRRLLGVPGYLAYAWELPSASQLPHELWLRLRGRRKRRGADDAQ